jgi:hypothetical protein
MAPAVILLGTQSSRRKKWRSPFDQAPTSDVLVVLESMTLVMPLAAETDGMVAEIGCRPGATVPAG